MECLSEDTVLALVDGMLTAAERDLVHQHLGECAACTELVGGQVEPPEGERTPVTAEERASDRAALEPPSRIGRFEVLSPVGAGGMGVVYAALDSQLGR